jgi:hypothetical protein
MSERISRTLLDQRIRNRIIEYLQIASSYEEQLRYEARVPIADVPAEIICQWSDQVNDHPLARYVEPVYSLEEQAAIANFQAVWERVISETPKYLPPLSELIRKPQWERLRIGALEALEVFLRRGKFDEEKEQFE